MNREIKFRAWAKDSKFKKFNGHSEVKRMFSWEDKNN